MMTKVELNGKELILKKGLTILQAIEQNGVKIPRFCFHEKLSIAGNCRMCLVEIGKISKPVASCTLSISDNMQIFTNTILVKKARESILELLLINHPLDCPICDQGGECDLQDQSFVFGNDKSRFYEFKRSVSDKFISPVIKTIMTRCIHCTRCVRFITEITGGSTLGLTGRGNKMEIGNYLNLYINSELSGNVIDLCPVGALTSKSYSFVARSWELKNYETIDVLDSLGSNIVIQMRGTQVLRVLPKVNEDLNEEWISDKIRFSLDGIMIQRLSNSFYQLKNNYKYFFFNFYLFESLRFINKFVVEWSYLYSIFKEQLLFLFNNKVKNIIVGNIINIESFNYLKLLSFFFNFNCIQPQYTFNTINFDLQKNYFSGVDPKKFDFIDICLLFGCNLRLESPLLNIRLRKSYLRFNTVIFSIGPTINPVYNLLKLGNSLSVFIGILFGKNKFNIILNTLSNIFFIYSFYLSSLLNNIILILKKLKYENFNIINLSSINSYVLGNDNGFLLNSDSFSSNSFNYLVGSDEIEFINNNCFNVYQGTHHDRSVDVSDIVFSSHNFYEENSHVIDYNGRSIYNKSIISFDYFINHNIRNSFGIINNLLIFLLDIKFNLFSFLLDIKFNLNKDFSNFNFVSKFYNIILNNFVSNYYKTDSITRSSFLMSKIVQYESVKKVNLNY